MAEVFDVATVHRLVRELEQVRAERDALTNEVKQLLPERIAKDIERQNDRGYATYEAAYAKSAAIARSYKSGEPS